MSWDITPNNDATYTLDNGSETIVRLHSGLCIDMVLDMFLKLDEASFPIEYSYGLQEIYFTYLKDNLDGDYCPSGKIRVSCVRSQRDSAHETLIHEIAHHVDQEECMTDDNSLITEWRENSDGFIHVDIHKEPSEYVAIGFEKFYVSNHSSGNITKESHPVLWGRINEIHLKKTVT